MNVMVPLVALLLLMHPSQDGRDDAQTSAFICYALILGSAVFVYFHWRIAAARPGDAMGRRLAGWLAVGLAIGAVQGTVQAVVIAPVTGHRQDSWPLVSQLVVLTVLGLIAYYSEQVDPPGDPALTGAVAGLTITAVLVVMMSLAPPFLPTPLVAGLLNAAAMVAGLVLALIVLQRTHVSLWVRRRLAFTTIVLTGAQCAVNMDHAHAVLMGLVVVANLVGSITLATMTQALLRTSLFRYHEELQTLHNSLDEVRAGVLEDRELLHEVGSTLAGITSASRMIHHGPAIPAFRRERLQELLDAELGRLERLMSARATTAVDYEVDAVVAQLALSHQTRGRDIRWQPSDAWGVGDPDDLAEVLNILLDNAAHHGGDGPIQLQVSSLDDFVEVTCADSGPGVDPAVRPRLFGSGASGPRSHGQGLGLSIAQRLMSDAGGSLELEDSDQPGARFVARIPRSVSADAAAHIA
jgi:signal transduction histidine kinase